MTKKDQFPQTGIKMLKDTPVFLLKKKKKRTFLHKECTMQLKLTALYIHSQAALQFVLICVLSEQVKQS